MCFHLRFYKTNALEIWRSVQHKKKELSNFNIRFSVRRGIQSQFTMTITSVKPLLDSSQSWRQHSKMPIRFLFLWKNEPAWLWSWSLKHCYFLEMLLDQSIVLAYPFVQIKPEQTFLANPIYYELYLGLPSSKNVKL